MSRAIALAVLALAVVGDARVGAVDHRAHAGVESGLRPVAQRFDGLGPVLGSEE
jgi:hypothetical protein